MKNIRIAVIALLALILVLASSVTMYAAQPEITVTPSISTLNAGDTFTLKFKCSEKILGAEMYVTYDKSVMTLDDEAFKDYIQDNSYLDGDVTETEDGDKVFYMLLQKSSTMFTLKFKLNNGVKTADALRVTISGIEATSADYTTLKIDDQTWSYAICRNHDWVLSSKKDATCTQGASERYKCKNCGERKDTVVSDPLGHDYKTTMVEATCTDEGYTLNKCDNCGDSKKTDIVSAKGHDYKVVSSTTTCSVLGKTTHTCTECNDSYTVDDKVKLDHKYVKTTVASTCVSYGKDVYTCSECSDSYEEKHNQYAPHEYIGKVKAPTCTDAGNTVFTCSVCNHTYVDAITSATGHSFGNWKTEIAATSEQEGIAKRICENCQVAETKKLEKLTTGTPVQQTEDTTWMLTLIAVLGIGIVILIILLIVLYVTFKKKREERRINPPSTPPTAGGVNISH